MKKPSLVALAIIIVIITIGYFAFKKPNKINVVEMNNYGSNIDIETSEDDLVDEELLENAEAEKTTAPQLVNEAAEEVPVNQETQDLDQETPSYKEIDVNNLNEKIKLGTAVVDIRTLDEWLATGTIETSFLITAFEEDAIKDTFKAEIESAIDKNEEVVIVCNTNVKSKIVAEYMAKKLSYKNVKVLKGGITSWIENSLPLTKSPEN